MCAGDLADRHGLALKGVVHCSPAKCTCTNPAHFTRQDSTIFASLDDPGVVARIGASTLAELREQLELVQGASHPFDREAYLAGQQSPVFFGPA